MTLRAGLVGTYDHVGAFADRAVKRAGVELVGAYEPDAQRAAGLVKNYGVKIFDSKEKLFDANLDMIGLFSPFQEKAQDIVECLDRGMHVFADKPAAINRKELKKVRAAIARHTDLRFTMALTQRFNPIFLKVRQLIDQGAVGKVVSLTVRNCYRLRRANRPAFMFDEKLSGGEWVELAVHGIHTAGWFAGGVNFVAVSAYQGNASSPEEPYQDHGEGLFELSNGVNAYIAHDRMVPAADPDYVVRYEVIGSSGRIFYDTMSGITLWNDTTKPTIIEDRPEALLLLDNFVDAIEKDVPLIVPAEEALHTTEVAIAAYESARAGGKRITL